MAIKDIIKVIVEKHKISGIELNIPATAADISAFERQAGFPLPSEFIEFYTTCDGFGCNEDIFNIIPLSGIRQHQQDYGPKWFYFSEYMIYSDMWGLRLTSPGKYEIFNGSYPLIPLTSSFEEFLNRFLKGNVFEPGGLYDWQNELKINRS
jgi:hypothetical protein